MPSRYQPVAPKKVQKAVKIRQIKICGPIKQSGSPYFRNTRTLRLDSQL